MAEIIGLAASVIALLQLGQAVGSAIRRYTDGVKNAKDDINTIEAELRSMKQVLEKLQAFLEEGKHEQDQLSALKDCKSSLEECRSVMEHIQQKLDTGLQPTKPSRRERLTNGIWKIRLVWPLQKGDVQKLSEVIARRREIIQLALTSDTA